MSPDLATITGRGTKRGTELMLLAFAVGIVLFAYANVGLAVEGSLPTDILTLGVGMGVIALVFHLVVRVVAAYADPVLLPAATLLNGLRAKDATIGLETMCVGGGQGMAVVYERLS